MLRLAVDQGNSRTKWALFNHRELVRSGELGILNVPVLQNLVKMQKAKYVILATTKHLSKRMTQLFDSQQNYLILSHKVELPLVIDYLTPDTLGQDRIALAAGAWALFPKQNSLIIDAGSCITYDIVNKEGHFLGGNISPGVEMRLLSMHHFTDKLPHAKKIEDPLTMGNTTISALQVGAQMGALMEIEGFINLYNQKLNKLNILLTGGDAHFFVNRLKTRIFAAPQLVLQGLNEILNCNVQKLS